MGRRCSSRTRRSSSGRERDRAEPRRRQLGQLPVGLDEAVQGFGAALYDAQAAAKVADGGFIGLQLTNALQQAAGDGLDGRERIGKLVAEHADQPLPGDLFLFLQGQAHVGQQKQRMGHTVLAEGRLAQQPARGLGAERVNGLVGGGEQIFKAQFARGAAKAAGVRQAEQAEARIVHQLQQPVAVKGEQRRVHDLKDARQQSRCLQRAHALFLQEIGQGIDLRRPARRMRLACRRRGRGRSNRPRAATKPRWRASARDGRALRSARQRSAQDK